MANETLGASFSIDVTDLKAGLAQANRLIKESESEFKAAAAGMDDWTQSSDGLNAKIKSLNTITEAQREKVNALQSEYDRLIADGLDPTSKQAVELRTKINNETAALNKNEAELQKQTNALEELENGTEEAGDAADDMGDKFSGLKKAGGIAAGAIGAVGTACAGVITAFFGLAESTRESRNEMAKLETAFQTAGGSAESAEKTFTELYGIMGDEGAAVEAAQHLAQLSADEETLNTMTGVLTGVYAKFGTSLPVEGLAEAVNHTAKLGTVQGPLADALEWSGVSVDDFNERLAECEDEQERAYIIQEQLTDLYWDAGEAYRENNAAVIEAREAQAGLNDAMNELGAIAEPIMTTLKTLATDLLQSIMPFVSLVGEGLAGALEGADGATDKLAEGITGLIETALAKVVEIAPFVIETVVSVFPKLLSSILEQLPTILQTLLTMVSETATALGGMLPTLIPVIIDAVIMLAETLIDNVDMIIDAGISLLVGLADGLIKALPKLVAKVPTIISKLVTALSSNWPKLLQTGVDLLVSLAGGLIKAIPQLVSKLPQIISSIVSGLKSGVSSIASVGSDLIRGLWNGISDMASWIYSKISGFGESVLSSLKSFFGIASPSKVMADVVGKNLALGIGKGFEDNIGAVNDEITSAMNFDAANINVNARSNGVGGVGGGVTVYQTNNYSQAHSRYELYKSKQQTAAAVRLALAGV